MRKRWTSGEKAILKQEARRLSVKALAKLLNRSEGAIRATARKLDIELRVAPKPHWTDEDIDLLRKYYETGSREDLLKLFPHRSWRSINHKGRRHQLVRASVKHYLCSRTIGDLLHDQRIYLAGLIDGEGTVTISVRKSKSKPGVMGSPLTPLIIITNTNKELIDHLRTTLHGSTLKTQHRTGHCKDVWALQVARLLDVKALLEQITPYLFLKRRQAELLLEFCNLRLEDKWMRYNPRLFEIAKEIRKLNRKGKT